MWSAARDGIRLDLPPMRKIADGHIVKCHLADADLDEMEPVISLAG
jgi:peptide/nickel transport system ATP-binding protein